MLTHLQKLMIAPFAQSRQAEAEALRAEGDFFYYIACAAFAAMILYALVWVFIKSRKRKK